MTGYRAIPDTEIDPDKFISGPTLQTLRDNPVAIAEGAVGAPRIQSAALDPAIVTLAKLYATTAGDYVVAQSSGGDTLTTSFTKHVEWKVGAAAVVRVRFTLTGSGGATAYATIYVNGAAAGTARSTTSTTGVTYTEDISVTVGDLVQIYLRTSNSSWTAAVSNALLMVGNPITPAPHVNFL